MKETPGIILSCLLQTYCYLSTNEKVFVSWQLLQIYGVISYGSGWRKDAVNLCLEFAAAEDLQVPQQNDEGRLQRLSGWDHVPYSPGLESHCDHRFSQGNWLSASVTTDFHKATGYPVPWRLKYLAIPFRLLKFKRLQVLKGCKTKPVIWVLLSWDIIYLNPNHFFM